MQRILITGAGGAVGRRLSEAARSAGCEAVGWNRQTEPLRPDHVDSCMRVVDRVRPAALVHLAIASDAQSPEEAYWINAKLPQVLADLCAKTGTRFVHTSSVMVFEEGPQGPYGNNSPLTAQSGYGAQKREAEEALRASGSGAVIARLGWQIASEIICAENSMTSLLDRQNKEHGHIKASEAWLPACSFLEDTAQELLRLCLCPDPPAVTQIDGNLGWTFADIAHALSAELHAGWTIQTNRDFVFDQRMISQASANARLDLRLPALAQIPQHPFQP